MKYVSILSGMLLTLLLAASASADSTTSGLNSGGTIQTQDQIPIYRPSNPGTNFRVSVGSAATQSIGTSGPTVPLMSTANTWSALQSFPSGDLSAADAIFTGGSIQVPVGNTSLRPSSAINGMIRYNTDTPGIETYANGAWGPVGAGMVYPSAGISVSTGTAWGTSLAVGTSANDLLQLNGSGQLPAVSAANLTNFPMFNQSTTGNAATATALAATPTPCSTGMAPTGILANGNSTGCASIGDGSSTTPVTTVAASGTSQAIAFPSSGNSAYDITLSANCAITLTGGTAGQFQTVTLLLRQNSTAGWSPVLPTGVKWSGGIAPTPNTTAGQYDVYKFSTTDGGTTISGSY